MHRFITLKELCDTFAGVDDEHVFSLGFCCPHVFHGNPFELGFELMENVSGKVVKKALSSAKAMEQYDDGTFVNLAEDGVYVFGGDKHKERIAFFELFMRMSHEVL